MMTHWLKISTLLLTLILPSELFSQNQIKPNTVSNDSLGSGLKFFGSGQIWLRHTQLNPGSMIDDEVENSITDISIRRFRLAFKGHPTERWFLKIQMGLNNLNYLNNNVQLKLLDLLAVYKVSDWLFVGAGKNGYSGPSRYASVASTSMLGVDVPIFALSTVNISDDLTRKFSVFTKGTLGKLGYRIIIAKPNRVKNATLSEFATFKSGNPHLQTSGYFKYQFLDREKRTSAYMPGTYFGTKKIVNIGVGFLQQKNTTWRMVASDTIKYNMLQLAVDLFVDLPLNNQNSKSFTFYVAYYNTDFGKDYLRNIGVNNPATDNDGTSFNGKGNAYPSIGSGSVIYTQIGMRFQLRKELVKIRAIQPYFSIQKANYERLDQKMILIESGFSLLSMGHHSKLTLGIQNRPVYQLSNSKLTVDSRSNMFVLQYQFKITH